MEIFNMIEYLGLENIIAVFSVVLVVVAFQLGRFSKNTLRHIDKLQERVDELEKRVGVQKGFDMDPLGFTRKEDTTS